ncbi:unnamed protein product [Prorocentrum cordatum]|uniref:Uncharacterized protein n=1 Tax=Prorocentrum cordatum TaxID=2364126 RepID=A0ABN9Y2U8_9DINO|nr:unnamed protein product [Polarella glacialis]
MVVASRLAWIRRQVLQGAGFHFSADGAAMRGRFKVEMAIDAGLQVSPLAQLANLGVDDHLLQLVNSHLSVDRGHRRSDGKREVSPWLSARPAPFRHGLRDEGDDGDAGDDGDGPGDGGEGRPGGRRRCRCGAHALPRPRGADPWRAGDGDPWSSAGQLPKIPRRSDDPDGGLPVVPPFPSTRTLWSFIPLASALAMLMVALELSGAEYLPTLKLQTDFLSQLLVVVQMHVGRPYVPVRGPVDDTWNRGDMVAGMIAVMGSDGRPPSGAMRAVFHLPFRPVEDHRTHDADRHGDGRAGLVMVVWGFSLQSCSARRLAKRRFTQKLLMQKLFMQGLFALKQQLFT